MWNYPAVCSRRLLFVLPRFVFYILPLFLSVYHIDPFILYLPYSSSHAYTYTFSTLPLILHQSVLRHVHTNRHATRTRHTYTHTLERIQARIIRTRTADGRNRGYKASLKTAFLSVMLRYAPHTKRSRRNDVFASRSLLVAAVLLFVFLSFFFFPIFLLSFFGCSLAPYKCSCVTRPSRKTRFTCSGCHAGWPPSPPVAICFSLSRPRGRLQRSLVKGK